MCSSWILFITDSILCLVDSWASEIQLNLVFASDALAFSVFETTVSRVHAWGNSLLHGIAAAFDVSNFHLAFFIKSLCSSSLFLFFSSLSAFSNSYPRVRPHVIWTWCRLDFCQSPPRPLFLFGGVSFNHVNLTNPFHESDKLLFKSTFQQSSTRFSCMTSRSVWVDLVSGIRNGMGNDSSFGTYN